MINLEAGQMFPQYIIVEFELIVGQKNRKGLG